MEMIADECGFGNVNSMRNVFQRTLKIAPGQYRRHFRHLKHSTQKNQIRNAGIEERDFRDRR